MDQVCGSVFNYPSHNMIWSVICLHGIRIRSGVCLQRLPLAFARYPRSVKYDSPSRLVLSLKGLGLSVSTDVFSCPPCSLLKRIFSLVRCPRSVKNNSPSRLVTSLKGLGLSISTDVFSCPPCSLLKRTFSFSFRVIVYLCGVGAKMRVSGDLYS